MMVSCDDTRDGSRRFPSLSHSASSPSSCSPSHGSGFQGVSAPLIPQTNTSCVDCDWARTSADLIPYRSCLSSGCTKVTPRATYRSILTSTTIYLDMQSGFLRWVGWFPSETWKKWYEKMLGSLFHSRSLFCPTTFSSRDNYNLNYNFHSVVFYNE